ncbi:hypothetical protein SAMD00019534_107410 [Acytostelium subglobosum LB1]|uniref:hypothetical protein n=1 Tax=Acytostelium subglobosum LB1 TaxID=1410327 RepID=UPI0006447F0C|nr:hypothetical protein SAMD00019534_107410 [Acytostelium subglobosum LB1]GAM27565.1 hypothetical protein SAMD00019534_107410 [Acytostelium subglobosum LB1]|eukprot:XP_012749630.1 hypothetical protein SAMD00019534_107410 [Acytostelium subglobosum LB1]
MFLLCLPSIFTTYLGIFYTVLSVVAVVIGQYGVTNRQKGATIVYCSISELCFFLASYNMFEFMVDDSSWLKFPQWAKILVLMFVLDTNQLYCIKLSLDLFKDPEKTQLLLDIEISDLPKPEYQTFDYSSNSSSYIYNSSSSAAPAAGSPD